MGMVLLSLTEASSFFQEIKGQDVKHESNIGLLNQLFNGQGDKSNFPGMRQHFVPPNSTSMSLGVQPQPFFRAIGPSYCYWLDGVAGQWLCGALLIYNCETLQVYFFGHFSQIFSRNIRQEYSTQIFGINIRD